MDSNEAKLSPAAFAMSALGLNLYPWQIDVLNAVGKGWPSVLCAANGSGKSSVVLPSTVLWFLSEHPRGRCVIVSGSWAQLKEQVFSAIRQFSDMPLFRGWEFLDTVVRTPKGGESVGKSSSEDFKVEGSHPRPGSPTLLIVDEGKAIDEPIFQSLDKCTWSFKMVVSSAGPPSGRFYQLFTSQQQYWWRKVVTWRDCPHLDSQQRLIDAEIYGEGSPYYRNRWLSEFATDSGTSVISLDDLRACVANPPEWIYQDQVSAGCDFAAQGSDHCAFGLCRGNKVEVDTSARWYWRHANPKESAAKFARIFRELGLRSDQISGDAGGLGVGFLYDLREAGYFVKEVHNGSPARDEAKYANLASEWWDRFSVLVKNRRIILPNNELLLRQLSDRERRDSIGGGRVRLKVESKTDMRARGVSSPDLAEAVIMALMSGVGSWDSLLSEKADAGLVNELGDCRRLNKWGRGLFAAEYVNWNNEY
jgi:phage terminase large subunit